MLQVTAYLRFLHERSSDASPSDLPRLAIQVGNDRLQAAGTDPAQWLTYSGSYNGWRHVPLAEITAANVGRIRVRWARQFDIGESNIEATPLVVDGVLFMVPEAGHVMALNAKTGDVIWEYKRPINTEVSYGYGLVNRGVAVHGGMIFSGDLDGYLVALNANDGKVIWQTEVASPSDGYSINGAPLVVNGSVVVGVAGGEGPIRGFLSAYDASSGREQWRFNTIPGPGEAGHETWKNDAWRNGGGGTWVTGSYDASTDLLYWGVGNPNPDFLGDVRPGDNLFTQSVIALHARTGKLVWFFQFSPHDEHDWDAAQTPVLADLPFNGMPRKVICWPNRNGFYYVLDRLTGGFLAGVPFVDVDWAQGLTSTGRPIPAGADLVTESGRRTRPGIAGATNWENPAYDNDRRLIFIPATESSSVFTKSNSSVTRGRHNFYLGSSWSMMGAARHKVIALDAATGQQKWTYHAPAGNDYSGLLSTEGGLVFGAAGGTCFALDADTGREVWRLPLGGRTRSPPISFTVDGQQVIAIAAGRALFLRGL
jgi:alcohol dehydrogenase (cytochrome c)